MQSFLQYRRIRARLEAQMKHDPEQFRTHHSTNIHDAEKVRRILTSSTSGTREAGLEDQHSLATRSIEDGPPSLTTSRSSETTSGESEAEKDVDFGPTLSGVDVRNRTTREGDKNTYVFVVGWTHSDPFNPHNWSTPKRIVCTLLVAMTAFVVMCSSAIDSAAAPQAAAALHASAVAESLATGLWLVGSGLGSMIAGPFSETFGRNPVYIGSMVFFMIFTMATALSPNLGAQLVFRFFVGVFASPPLVCGGGTISDLWSPLEKTWAFSVFAIPAFGGPMLGPVIGSYIYELSWRWTDWITLIMAGLSSVLTFCLLPETHPGVIQSWKAAHLRSLNSDSRYVSRAEIIKVTFLHRLEHALVRPFILGTEAIVIAISIYLTIIWSILFIFLDGYVSIFQETYRLSQGLNNVLFLAMYVGVLCSIPLVFWVYHQTKAELGANDTTNGPAKPRPETRLYNAMIGGGWTIPVALFWLAWTSYPSVSIWCPLLATTLFGFGLINIFVSTYMYIIDAYEVNAASGLAFTTVTRYLVSGGITVAGVPFFEKVGHHWTLTILAVLSLIFGAPVPYLLYHFGPGLRRRSANCINKS